MVIFHHRNKFKNLLKNFLFKKGFDISRVGNTMLQNRNPFLAAKDKIKDQDPLFFDVGANHGQTIEKIKKIFPGARIHGFEPSKYIFQKLQQNFISDSIFLNNLAIGEKEENLSFNEYSWDPLNSLLKRTFTRSKIIDKYDVQVTTIDNYCKRKGIEKIDFLKTDTEGFELNVLKGAKQLIKDNKIYFVHVELFFESHFVGQASAGDIFNFLESHNFSLVRFYDISLTGNGTASKADALFINLKYNKE